MSFSSVRRVRSSLRASAATSPLAMSARRSRRPASRSSDCRRSTVPRILSISRFFSNGLKSMSRMAREICTRVRATSHFARTYGRFFDFGVFSSLAACFRARSYSFAILSMYFSVCLVLLAIFSSVSSSSSNWTISLMERTPLRRSSPTAISSLITMGERVMDFMTTSCPRSMRLAMVTSPSRVSSGTVPISRRYMRTGSFVFSSEPGVRSRSLSPSCASSLTTTS